MRSWVFLTRHTTLATLISCVLGLSVAPLSYRTVSYTLTKIERCFLAVFSYFSGKFEPLSLNILFLNSGRLLIPY